MASTDELIDIVEQCKISPFPRQSPQAPPVPLTYFDLVFLRFPPVQRCFFYDYPHPISHFLALDLPNLKHSLAHALHQFYPLAATLLTTSNPPRIYFNSTNAINFTIAVALHRNNHYYFNELSADHVRHAKDFHGLVPQLGEAHILSVQVTVFPNAGIVIGTTVHHGVADGSTYKDFMNAWAWTSSANSSTTVSNKSPPPPPPPSFDRSLIQENDHKHLLQTFLKDIETTKLSQALESWDLTHPPQHSHLVRGTFLFSKEQLAQLRSRTSMKCSSNSLVCGYIWASLVRSRADSNSSTTCNAYDDEMEHFGFVTGCRARHDPPLPATYFGNCLGICCVEAKRSELVGRDGVKTAAEAIWRVIEGLEEGVVLEEAESWVKNVAQYARRKALTVAGSTKLGVYRVDFGWGRPRKVEILSIEKTGAMALAESRDGGGGIEVGLALPEEEMLRFVQVFENGWLLF